MKKDKEKKIIKEINLNEKFIMNKNLEQFFKLQKKSKILVNPQT